MQSKVFDFQTANVPDDETKECETLSHSTSLHSVPPGLSRIDPDPERRVPPWVWVNTRQPPGGAAYGKIKIEGSREIVEIDAANTAIALEDRNNPESTNLMDVVEVQRATFLSSVIFPSLLLLCLFSCLPLSHLFMLSQCFTTGYNAASFSLLTF